VPVADPASAHRGIEALGIRVAFDDQRPVSVRRGGVERMTKQAAPERASDEARVEPEVGQLALRRVANDAVHTDWLPPLLQHVDQVVHEVAFGEGEQFSHRLEELGAIAPVSFGAQRKLRERSGFARPSPADRGLRRHPCHVLENTTPSGSIARRGGDVISIPFVTRIRYWRSRVLLAAVFAIGGGALVSTLANWTAVWTAAAFLFALLVVSFLIARQPRYSLRYRLGRPGLWLVAVLSGVLMASGIPSSADRATGGAILCWAVGDLLERYGDRLKPWGLWLLGDPSLRPRPKLRPSRSAAATPPGNQARSDSL
jgi:hypothetical protein